MKNLQHEQKLTVSNARMVFERNRSCCNPLYIMKLLIEIIREFNLENHLAFLDHVKDFDRVRRDKLFEILHSKNIHFYY
jgi:hypothetical protein